MRDLLKSLAGCQDVASLRSTIHEFCAGFGEIAHMDIVTMAQPGKRQALCFLRLESAAQETRFMADSGVTRFGDDLLCVVNLPEEAKPAERPENFRPRSNEPRRHGAYARRALDRKIGWQGADNGLVR